MNEDDLFKGYSKARYSASLTVNRRQAFKIAVQIISCLVRHPRSKSVDIALVDDTVGSRNA
jgi:hypothetical protein